VALRRVWSRLAQVQDLVPQRVDLEPSPRRVRWPFIAVASLAGAAAAVTFMLVSGAPKTPAPVATRATDAPTATARRADPDRSTLVGPATVRTGDGETLHLALRGGAEATVTSNSALVLDESERPTVSKGEVDFHVAPQPPGRTFAVRANRYRVVVVGTRFRVHVNGNDTAIGVDEGIVEVWDADTRLTRLRAGEAWSSPPAIVTPLPATGVAPPSAAITGKRNDKGAVAPRGSRAVHGLRAAYTPGGAVATAPAAPSVTVGASSSGSLIPVAPTGASQGLPSAPERAASPAVVDAPAPAPSPATAPSPSDVVSLGAQARAARTAGDARKALGLYRALAQRGGAAGENAEYEIGRILRDGLHQPREAVAAWRSYRSGHARGLLRAEADISIIETLASIGDRSAALGEALEFVRRFPDSERRAEIGGLAGDLYRERGDFRSAVAEYDRALESARGRREGTDALSFHRAVCLLHEDHDAGVSALRAYLQSFPGGRFRSQTQRLLEDHAKASPSRKL
ncbi:MAG TPA: FecR domain-containing protein, partial [Polyangia bacterium]|nr:FecR domain-containing protein [Polyangia bacterium]